MMKEIKTTNVEKKETHGPEKARSQIFCQVEIDARRPGNGRRKA